MTAQRWHIRDHAGQQAALAQIGQAQPPFVLTLKPGKEKRRDRQNRFAFGAYNQIARILGDRTPEDVRAESKLCVAVPILRGADEYFRAQYDRVIRPHDYETKLALMIEPIALPVTSLMDVQTMARYITQLLQYWDERGANAMMERYDL